MKSRVTDQLGVPARPQTQWGRSALDRAGRTWPRARPWRPRREEQSQSPLGHLDGVGDRWVCKEREVKPEQEKATDVPYAAHPPKRL